MQVKLRLHLIQSQPFPEANYTSLVVYITGHYVPQLSEKIFEENKKVSKKEFINFKGFIVSFQRPQIYFSRHVVD